MIKKFLLFFLFLGTLQATLKNPGNESVTEGDPMSTVCDCVNLLTGDFVAFSEDHVIEGARPLHIYRTYASGNGKGEFGGWEFYPHTVLKTILFRKKSKKFKEVIVREPHGTRIVFKRIDNKHHFRKQTGDFYVDFEKNGKGITNTARGEISARTNLKNYSLYQFDEETIILYCADGTKRYYRNSHRENRMPVFLLDEEQHPDGHHTCYKYDNEHRLEYIEKKSKDKKETYNWCRFYYSKKPKTNDFRIATSDGRVLSYEFLCKGKSDKKPRYFLKHVEGSRHPPELIEYNKKHGDTDHLVERRSLPDNREIKALYYQPGETAVDRVKTILKPFGEKGELIPIYQFTYNFNQKTTEVFNYKQNKTQIKYTPSFLPTEVNFFDGVNLHHSYHSTWDEEGKLRIKTFKSGNTPLLSKKYEYDEKGNILKETLSGVITGKKKKDTYQCYQKYDEFNRLIQKLEPSGLITKLFYHNRTPLIAKKIVTDNHSIHLREFHTYDNNNNLIAKLEDDGISEDPEDLSGVTHRRAQFLTLKKENPGLHLPEIIEEKAFDRNISEWITLSTTRLEYNKQTQITVKEIYDQNDTLLSKIEYKYTHHGYIAMQRDPLGRVTNFEYDVHGNLIRQVDPDLKQTIRIYDTANRLIEERELAPNKDERVTKHKYDHGGNKILTIDPFGNATRYEYDNFRNVIAITHPDGITERFSYDALGNPTSYTDPKGNKTRKIYNIFGKPLRITYPDHSFETFEYTVEGNLKTHTNQEGLTLRFEYDALGRKTSITYISSEGVLIATETFTYKGPHLISHTDKEGITTTYEYNIAGQQSSIQRGTIRTEYEYDDLGRLIKEIQVDEENPLITTCEYDAASQLIKMKRHNETTTFTYDTRGNRIQIKKANYQENYTYDCFNRLILHEDGEGYRTVTAYDENYPTESKRKVLRTITTDPLGYKTIHIYDVFLRPASKRIQDPYNQTIFFEEYFYDSCGNCTLQKCHIYDETTYTHTLPITKEYDKRNRLIRITEGDTKTTTFTYTPSGKLSRTTKPDGTILSYTYDNLSNLIELISSDGTIHYTYEYDLNGNLLQSHDHILQTSTQRQFDENGLLLAETLANGLTIENNYDNRARRTHLQLPSTTITYTHDPLHLTSIHALDREFIYEYDLDGNILRRGDTIYTYDKCNRPIQLENPDYTQAIQYDPRGNIIEIHRDNHPTKYRYDGLGQIIKESGHKYNYDSYYNRKTKDDTPYITSTTHALLSAGATTYVHDPNGNPISKTTPASTTYYKYDALDRLIEVILPNQRITYTYDSFNRRMTKTVHTDNHQKIHKFLYDNQREIGSYQGNELQELRIVGHNERDTCLILLHNEIYIPIQDLQGNIVQITGPQIHAFRYNAFGEEYQSPSSNPWRYASKRYDTETGLIYFGHRYYDPETGRWLTPDPNTLTDSANLYAYTYNNPFLYIDAYGLLSWPTNIKTENYEFNLTKPPPPPEEMKYIPFEENIECIYRSMNSVQGLPTFNNPPCPYAERSKHYTLGRPEVPNRKIVYINGILNEYKDAVDSAKYISDLAGGVNVEGIHVASFGLKLDTYQNRILQDYAITESVKLSKDFFTNYFENSAPDATMMLVLFSNGNSVARNALLNCPEEYRNRISALSLAPVSHIDPGLVAAVRAFAATNDRLSNFDTWGMKHHGHNLIRLKPHPDANQIFDHALQSPTFREVIQNNVSRYLKNGTLSNE